MRRFLRRFAEQQPIIGDNADRNAHHMREAAHNRTAIPRLKFAQARAIHQAGDDFAHVIRAARVGGNHAVQFVGIVQRLFGRLHQHGRWFAPIQMAHDFAYTLQRFMFIVGEMVSHAAETGMHVRAA